MKVKGQSIGELISSFCFAGVGIFWLLYGIELWLAKEIINAILLLICSVCCFLGSVRFKISALAQRLRND